MPNFVQVCCDYKKTAKNCDCAQRTEKEIHRQTHFYTHINIKNFSLSTVLTMMDQKTNKIIKKGDITNPSHRLNDKVMLSNITFY